MVLGRPCGCLSKRRKSQCRNKPRCSGARNSAQRPKTIQFPVPVSDMMRVVLTFAIALFGVWVFHLLTLPLPWLLGPISACLAAALLGFPLQGIKQLNEGMRTILGVAVGATFTPALLLSMTGMWPTLLLIPVMTICIGLLGVPYFHRLWKYDFPTSYYATMPGGLQDMIVFGEEAGANVRTLSVLKLGRTLIEGGRKIPWQVSSLPTAFEERPNDD